MLDKIKPSSSDDCELKQKADDMGKLIDVTKERLKISGNVNQIQILTIAASLE